MTNARPIVSPTPRTALHAVNNIKDNDHNIDYMLRLTCIQSVIDFKCGIIY